MLAVFLTILFPVLPYVLWKSYNREKRVTKGEAVLRYLIYAFIICFLSAILLILLSDPGTSFREKMDKSTEFVLKYVIMGIGIGFITAFMEWNYRKKKVIFRIKWEKFGTWKPLMLCGKYILPVLPYLLAFLGICLNVSLMFDNVVWGDEAFSVNTAEKSMFGIMQIMYYLDNHPPLYYYWLKLFGELFGFSIPVCHLASLIPYVGGILLAVFWFQKEFGKIPATFFVVISSLSATCVEYNLEIRMYALAFFCVAACYYCSCRVVRYGKRTAWTGMVLWGLAGAYTHYYALVTTGIILFFTGVAVWIRQRGRTWLKGMMAILAFLLGYSPWLYFLFTAIHNVSGNWWVTEIISLGECLDMVMGGREMMKIISILLIVTGIPVILADSGIFRVVEQRGDITVEMHRPSMKKWSDETYFMAIGLLTIAGTIAFGYFLCLIMPPVLVGRYLYPLSAVAFCMLMVSSSRALELLRQLGEKLEIHYLRGIGKGMLVFLLCILLVIGIGNYQSYSVQTRSQNERTMEALKIIGIPDKDVRMVTNGVKHLGWTVLCHYYHDNEVVNGDYNMAGAERFWYFNPFELSQDELKMLKQGGISVTVYGEQQIAKYPFYLYYMDKTGKS